jgi:O-antigen ligase
VGLYFIDEATLFGHPTGIVFLQNYGPFVGPETTPLALGIAAALYLRSVAKGLTRLAWSAALVVLLIGLLSTFSREGWLIAVVACLALAMPRRASVPMVRPAFVTGVALLVIFVAGITNAVGVLGRMDLTTSWYGAHGASVLLNPNPTQRGQSQTGTTTSTPTPATAPAAPLVARTLAAPCVAQPPSSGSSSGSPAGDLSTGQTVELKGYSSLLARLCLWEAAARAIIHSPIVGYGLGTDADAIIPFFNGQDAGVRGATTHNTYLRIGVEMGIPGLAIYIAITLIAAWMALTTLRRGQSDAEAILAASILGITVAELTGTLLFAGLSFPGFWLAMSVALIAVKGADESREPIRNAS